MSSSSPGSRCTRPQTDCDASACRIVIPPHRELAREGTPIGRPVQVRMPTSSATGCRGFSLRDSVNRRWLHSVKVYVAIGGETAVPPSSLDRWWRLVSMWHETVALFASHPSAEHVYPATRPLSLWLAGGLVNTGRVCVMTDTRRVSEGRNLGLSWRDRIRLVFSTPLPKAWQIVFLESPTAIESGISASLDDEQSNVGNVQ